MTRSLVVRALLIAPLAVSAPGCGGFGSEEERVVVSVGERDFSQADLDRFLRSRTGLGGTSDAPLLSALLEEFVREQLLLIAADEAGVEVPETQIQAETSRLRARPGMDAVQAADDSGQPDRAAEASSDPEGDDGLRAQVEARLRVNRLMETVVLDGIDVTEEALRLEFEANRAFYARPETVTLSERRFESRDAAETAAGRLRQTDSQESDESSDPFVGIGSFRRGELPDAVDAAVFGLEPGDTTGAVETAAGFRVFRVDRRLPAASLEFEDVEDVVRLTVLRQEADARVETLLEELQENHPVTVRADNLSFPYVGSLPKAE